MDDFSRNLLLLCRYYPSIADVCRKVGVNRQQFNKYLSGKNLPSRHNLQKIGEFFGVDEGELFMSHDRFAEIIKLRPRKNVTEVPISPLTRHLELLARKGSKGLDSYCGYYFRYFVSYGFPGYIVKSLVGWYKKDDAFYTKNIGVLSVPDAERRYTVRFKYVGIPLLINDRIFLIEYESVLQDIVSETILYPAYRNRSDILSGIQCTVAGQRSREPAAGRVAFDHIGRQIDVRRALRTCGLYPADGNEVPPAILRRITNRIEGERGVLLAEQ